MAGELRLGRARHHPGEGLTRVELLVRLLQLVRAALQVEVAARQDAADHRQQVGQERDPRSPAVRQQPQLLRHLRRVPVAADRVGLGRLGHLGEVDPERRRAAGSRDPGLAVDDDVSADQVGRDRRRQAEDGRGRVAAGDGDEARPGQLCRVQLGQAEHGLREELRSRVLLPVPPGVLGRVPESEVRAHVDDAGASPEPRSGPDRAHVVREAAEHDLHLTRVQVLPEGALEPQEREDGGVGLARVGPRGELRKLHARMAGEEVDERHARVPAGSRDRRLHDRHVIA